MIPAFAGMTIFIMKVLAFDTSTKYLTIALLEDDKVVAEYHEEAGIQHSRILVSSIDDILKRAGWELKEIELICVGTGPGSFTGLRIAMATVKGFAAVLGVEVIGIPTLDAIAMNVVGQDVIVAPFLDARKGKVYSCFYRVSSKGLEKISDYLLLTVDEVSDKLKEKTLFFGDAVGMYEEYLKKVPLVEIKKDIDWYPKAADIGRLGMDRAKQGLDDPEYLEPLYMHAKECNITVPKGK